MPTKYKIPEVTAEAIMETVEGVSYKNSEGFDMHAAADYLGKTTVYAKRALDASLQLGFTELRESKFFLVKDASDAPRASAEQRPLIFRKFLQRFDPFILFIVLVGRGNSIEDGARKVKVIYDLEAGVKIIASTLVSWGEFSQMIKKEKGKIILQIETEKLSAEYIRELLEAMEHDVKARMYIAGKLGDEVFGYMKQDEIDFLVKAIREHQNDPRGSIDDAGRAFEDFLRRTATDKGIAVTHCKGIQELADALRGDKRIEVKQLEVCKGINSLRIAAAHSKDRVSVERWILNKDTAIECILMTLTMIRSIHNYVFKQVQMF
jgi:hypothetical protein